MDAADAGRATRALDVLHAQSYFAPEVEEALVAAGLRPGRMCYFASRSAALGPVGPGPVAATFFNFNPSIVERHIPRAWGLTDPAALAEVRLDAAVRSLRRLLGDAADSPEVAEAAELARRATDGCSVAGRPLYAGHASLDWPDEPLAVLWHAVTLLREHRGDGHVAALVGSGLTGLEALVTHTATGKGFTVAAAQLTRGWSEEEWVAAADGLRERNLLDADGALTEAGAGLRADVEAVTDRSAYAPWRRLGDEAAGRLADLGRRLAKAAVAAGAFPGGVFATARA